MIVIASDPSISLSTAAGKKEVDEFVKWIAPLRTRSSSSVTYGTDIGQDRAQEIRQTSICCRASLNNTDKFGSFRVDFCQGASQSRQTHRLD